jgi:hypothetical protein
MVAQPAAVSCACGASPSTMKKLLSSMPPVLFRVKSTMLKNSTLFYRACEGEQILMKKGQGQIIHVSDFVEEENGQLIICDREGAIVKDAQKIIYPSAKGDP